MIDLQSWESSVLGQVLDSDGVKGDSGQCSQVPISWAQALFPGVKWSDMLVPVGSDKGVNAWAGKSTKYFTWIENNHADANQLPLPGDVLVFDATPAKGYTSTFQNPYGHTGVCKSASTSGYTLIQQNAPALGQGVNDTSYPWNYRPCMGWFRATANAVPAPNPAPAPVAVPVSSVNVNKVLNLPASINHWNVYNPAGPYDTAHAIHALNPAEYGGLQYTIEKDLGNGIYQIHTDMFGDVAIWTQGTVATITDPAPAPTPPPTPAAAPATNMTNITVQAGWGLERVAEAAGRADAAQPACWQAIAVANGSDSWQSFNAALKVNQVVKVPLS